jgi:hypothetical protein
VFCTCKEHTDVLYLTLVERCEEMVLRLESEVEDFFEMRLMEEIVSER